MAIQTTVDDSHKTTLQATHSAADQSTVNGPLGAAIPTALVQTIRSTVANPF